MLIYQLSIVFWVLGNTLWAVGEMFYDFDDDGSSPDKYMFQSSEEARNNWRYFIVLTLFIYDIDFIHLLY